MIAAQIERLSATEQRVLEVAAIAGMSFTPAIRAPTGLSGPRLLRRVLRRARAAEPHRPAGGHAGAARRASRPALSFVHALYREVLYERQAPARRAMLHRRGAERLEELFAASLDEVAPELAHHFEQGADWPRAVKYLRPGSPKLPARRGATLEAKANLQHALTLAPRLPPRERVDAEVGILDELLGISLASWSRKRWTPRRSCASGRPSTG